MIRTLLIFILLNLVLFAQKEAFLQINTGAHLTRVNKLLVTKNQDIITCSDDKSISIWDIKNGKEKRKILGQIGVGDVGKIYAIALSPDEKNLAVGGVLNNNVIRIYNYETGKLTQLLKSHTDEINDLTYTHDGKYLLSASTDASVKIWDVNRGYKISQTLKRHNETVNTIKTFFKNGKNYSLSSSLNNKLMLYNITDDVVVKIIQTAKSFYHLAVSNKHIAAGSDPGHNIYIYDLFLNQLDVIDNGYKIGSLDYSLDGKKLLVGAEGNMDRVQIYNTLTPYRLKRKYDFEGVHKAKFIDNTYAVHTDAYDKSILVWNTNRPMDQRKIQGLGQNIYYVRMKEDKLAWGNDFIQYPKYSTQNRVTKSFDLKTHEIRQLSSDKGWGSGDDKPRPGYSLKWKGNRAIGIYKSNEEVATIYARQIIHSMGWMNGYIVAAYDYEGEIGLFNTKGEFVRNLKGHTAGYVNSMAERNGLLLSGGSDKVMRLWDLNFLNKSPDITLEASAEVIQMTPGGIVDKAGLKRGDIIYAVNGKSYPSFTKLDDDGISGGGDFSFSILRKGLKKEISFSKSKDDLFGFTIESPSVKPLLNIFVAANNEWVIWTKEGFFDASKNGLKLVGFHINQGEDKEAKYYHVEKFYNSFYRPDLIARALKGESLVKYARSINIDKLLSSGLAPKVTINTKSHKSQKRDVTLNLKVCENDGGFDNLTLFLNDIAIDVLGGDRALKMKRQAKKREHCFEFEKLISLRHGENKIGFKATNRDGNIESNLDEITINYKGHSNKKPNLYILALGVDKYRDGDLWLKYSKADANAFVKTISDVSKGLFNKTYTYKLLDRDVTKKNIQAKFAEIGSKTTREDVFMLYVAGHGITDTKTGAYFYLPVDFRFRNEDSVRNYGVSQKDFKQALSKIQAMKSLTILDTCNSGSFAEAMASRGVLQKTAINKLTRATGRATIVASSKDQVALEGYKGHGVFTYTLIEALRGKAFGYDKKITIKELAAYVEDVLPDRTYDKWGYEQVPQSNITGNDFPIGLK